MGFFFRAMENIWDGLRIPLSGMLREDSAAKFGRRNI